MYKSLFFPVSQPRLLIIAYLCVCLLLLAACSNSTTTASSSSAVKLAKKQVFIFPNVGIQDLDNLDPAQESNTNEAQAISMVYSGLVRQDQSLNVIADQATWVISPDRKVYTFYLKAGITFSDGTPVTAQTYVYSLTRALLPAVQANEAL